MGIRQSSRGSEYHRARISKGAIRYRLERRTSEVLKALLEYKGLTVRSLLDIGTADGLMLDSLTKNLRISRPVGLDLSFQLLRLNPNSSSHFCQGNALRLPFKDGAFEVIVAAALIEHLRDDKKLLMESYRVLQDGGLLVVTTPDPFWEWVAVRIGHLPKEEHVKTFTLPRLMSLFQSHRFDVLKAEKFMISPIGLPFGEIVERVVKLLGMGCFLCNQLIVSRKSR